MSYYPKRYPTLEQTEWLFQDFSDGEHEGTASTAAGLQLLPGKETGAYVSSLIDAGQAVAWRDLVWDAEIPEGASIAFRTTSGRPEDGRRACRWSAKHAASPAKIVLLGSLEGGVKVAADRYLQIRVEMRAGPNGSPTLKSWRVSCGLVAPACVGPKNHAVIEPGGARFHWTRVEGAASYLFELSDGTDFARLLHSQSGLTDSSFDNHGRLAEGVYYWRVRAVDGKGGLSEYSPVRQFAVREAVRPDLSHLKHPYLYFSREDVPELRVRAKSRYVQCWQAILEQADAALTAELPEEKDILAGTSQHGGFHELNANVGHARLIPLSLAFVITEDAKYASKARELLMFLAGLSRWTGPKFGDPNEFYPTWASTLETSTIARLVTTAYDWLYDYLVEGDRARIRAGILRLGLLPLLASWTDPEMIRFVPRHQTAAGNWWGVCNAGGGFAALGLINEVEEAREWARAFGDSIRDFLCHAGGDVTDIHLKAGHGEQDLLITEPNWDDDGGYNESIGYSSYGLSNALHFLYALRRVTGEEMSEYICSKAADYPYYFGYWAEDGSWSTIPFNDSRRANWGDDIYALLASLNGSGRAKYMLDATWPTRKNVTAFLIGDTPVAPQLPDESDRNKLFPRIGWSVFRSGWGKDASLLAAKFHQGRGHNDLGQYAVNYRGREFVVDSEISVYTDPHYHAYSRTSWGHNVVVVDDTVQLRVDGNILGYAEALGSGIVEADMTAAYQDLVESWTRTLVFLEPGLFVVIDRLVSDEERTFNWLVHPKGEINLDEQSGAVFTQGDTEMKLLMLSPRAWKCTSYDGYVESTPTKYLGFATERPLRTVMFAAVLVGSSAGEKIGAEMAYEGDGVRTRIVAPDATYMLSTHPSVSVIAESAGKTNWVAVGPSPVMLDGRTLAPASEGSEYRAG